VPVIFSSHQLELVERLCDSLAIIAAGKIVATGPLDRIGGGRPLAEVFREATRGEDGATGTKGVR
jgi:ABC-2 type transport system ATP-binding protein